HRSRRRASPPPRPARPGDARPRPGDEGLRAADDRSRDERRPAGGAEGPHGEPPRARPPDRPAPPGRPARIGSRGPAPLLPRRTRAPILDPMTPPAGPPEAAPK